jgi:acyl-CoA synthetase (AMP-forming)/AMP-acid ligase II
MADWSKVPDIEPRVPALLEYCAKHLRDHELMVVDERRFTYGELCAQSSQVARLLLQAGVTKHTRVGILLSNTPEFLATWFGITRIGAVAVPISTLSTPTEIRRIVHHSSVHLLIAMDRYLHHNYIERLESAFPDLSRQTGDFFFPEAPYFRAAWVLGETVPGWATPFEIDRKTPVSEEILAAVEAKVHSSDPVSIMYTSGSTADPKGVIHTHGNFLRQGARLAAVYPYDRNDRIFTQMPFFWVGGLTLTIMPVMHAGATMLTSSITGSALLDFCEKERMTYMVGWPHLARMMADDPTFLKRDWSAMRGGRLYELLPGAAAPKNHFANNMGMTETCGSHHMSIPYLPDDLKGSLGIPMPGTERRVIDIDSGEVITDETPGVLQVRGDCVLAGMVDKEKADVFDADGWYTTGDISSIRKGHVFFHGRMDDMIKASGANVSPREVEAVLLSIPGVAQAYVSGLADPVRGTVVGAVIGTQAGKTLDAGAVQKHAAQALSSYKVPRTVLSMEATQLPMMSSGKVDRRKILSMLAEAHARTA